jgi:hypothetical protein
LRARRAVLVATTIAHRVYLPHSRGTCLAGLRLIAFGQVREGCYNLGHSRRFAAIKTFLCWLLLLEDC